MASMEIEIKEKGSEAFYRETVNVAYQGRALLKRPDKKLGNHFKMLRNMAVIYSVILAVFVALALLRGANSSRIVIITIMSLGVMVSILSLKNMNQFLQEMMNDLNDSYPAFLSLDEQGVALKRKSRTVHLAWDSVAFVRVFRESICFLPKGRTGFVITVDKRYAGEISEWLRANKPEVMLIQ